MKWKAQSVLIFAILFVFLGILLSQGLGWWQTSSTKVPQKLKDVQSAEGDAYDPAQIRGSYTFGDICQYFPVPLEDLALGFGVEADKAKTFKVKELENLYPKDESEIGTSSVRLFVALYTGLPYQSSEESFLPEAAVLILKEKASLSEDQLNYLDSHSFSR